MARKTSIVPALVTLIALIASGCGSQEPSTVASNTATTSTVPTVAKPPAGAAQFIAQADPICKQIAVKREAANKKLHETGNSLRVLAKEATVIAAQEQQAVNHLRALSAPAVIASEWQTLIAGMQQLVGATKQLGHYALYNEAVKAKKLTASSLQVRKKLATIAAHDGFKYCGLTS